MIIKIGNKPYELATKEEVMKEVTEEMSAVKKEIFENLYPVGSVYISLSSTFDPNTAWNGTTWEKIKEGIFLEATEVAGDVGTEKEAGLPNITGSFAPFCTDGANGAFTKSGGSNGWVGSGPYVHRTISLNASRSSAVYGKSDTVQPHSVKTFIWKRIS